MLMVCTNDGKKEFLNIFFGTGGSPFEDLVVHLYKNNYTPVDDSETADFTESDFVGYLYVTIGSGAMDAAIIVANVGVSNYNYPPTFNCTGGPDQYAYGWYMTGDTTGETYFAQRFDTPRLMTAGASEVLDPFQFKSKSFA